MESMLKKRQRTELWKSPLTYPVHPFGDSRPLWDLIFGCFNCQEKLSAKQKFRKMMYLHSNILITELIALYKQWREQLIEAPIREFCVCAMVERWQNRATVCANATRVCADWVTKEELHTFAKRALVVQQYQRAQAVVKIRAMVARDVTFFSFGIPAALIGSVEWAEENDASTPVVLRNDPSLYCDATDPNLRMKIEDSDME